MILHKSEIFTFKDLSNKYACLLGLSNLFGDCLSSIYLKDGYKINKSFLEIY